MGKVASKRLDRDTLLAFCGSSQDCRMQVLDHRWPAGIQPQLELCLVELSGLSQDCARHRLDRWLKGHPSEEEIQALIDWGELQDVLAPFVATAVVCGSRSGCEQLSEERVEPGPPSPWGLCEREVRRLRQSPQLCQGLWERSAPSDSR